MEQLKNNRDYGPVCKLLSIESAKILRVHPTLTMQMISRGHSGNILETIE